MPDDGDWIGWDVGGAHLKAARLGADGRLRDAAEWACRLWTGPGALDEALDEAEAQWPDLLHGRHAVTMTGEMTDAFPDRATGVAAISARLAARWPAALAWAGGSFLPLAALAQRDARWAQVASANWRATAQAAALAGAPAVGVLVDIGSTTCDLIAFGAGQVRSASVGDADRLGSGELVYQGVVRTPLCALGANVPFGGRRWNVMNEWFATSADVHRLCGGLHDAHDLHPSADGRPKDVAHARARLARMIGRDAAEAGADQWLELAQHWRRVQVETIRVNLERVRRAAGLGDSTEGVLISAGCGAFLVDELRPPGWHVQTFAGLLGASGDLATAVQVAAPAAAVAWLAAGADRTSG